MRLGWGQLLDDLRRRCRRLVATAWNNYRIVLTLSEASWRRSFLTRYATYAEWMARNHQQCTGHHPDRPARPRACGLGEAEARAIRLCRNPWVSGMRFAHAENGSRHDIRH